MPKVNSPQELLGSVQSVRAVNQDGAVGQTVSESGLLTVNVHFPGIRGTGWTADIVADGQKLNPVVQVSSLLATHLVPS
jgi:hypothetical protein